MGKMYDKEVKFKRKCHSNRTAPILKGFLESKVGKLRIQRYLQNNERENT